MPMIRKLALFSIFISAGFCSDVPDAKTAARLRDLLQQKRYGRVGARHRRTSNCSRWCVVDTGAPGSQFGVRFYRAAKSQLTRKMRAKIESAGAGGMRHFRGYKMDRLNLSLGGQDVILPSATILAQPIGGDGYFLRESGAGRFSSVQRLHHRFSEYDFQSHEVENRRVAASS